LEIAEQTLGVWGKVKDMVESTNGV